MGLFAELSTDGSPGMRPASMAKSELNLQRRLRDGTILRPDASLARCAPLHYTALSGAYSTPKLQPNLIFAYTHAAATTTVLLASLHPPHTHSQIASLYHDALRDNLRFDTHPIFVHTHLQFEIELWMGKDGIKQDGMSWTTLGWIKSLA